MNELGIGMGWLKVIGNLAEGKKDMSFERWESSCEKESCKREVFSDQEMRRHIQ